MTQGKVAYDPQTRDWFYAEKQAKARARRRRRLGKPSPYILFKPISIIDWFFYTPLGWLVITILYILSLLGIALYIDNYGN